MGKARQGFALMIVISLLAITSSLIVGFSILANLEHKKIDNLSHSAYAIARQNTLLAVRDAIAKLQTTTGQDTAVTAKADLLGGTTEGQKHWVGTWKVQKCDDKVVTGVDTKEFLAWLVSGDFYRENDHATALSEPNRISIVNPEHTNIDPVYVKLIDITDPNGQTGQYAYWVDDQSLKIQCNLYDPGNHFEDLFSAQPSITEMDDSYFKRQFQACYGLEMVDGSEYCPLSQSFLENNRSITGDPSYTHLLEHPTFSQQQYQFLQQKFHDFTSLSLGLITSTRSGGFRKNLRDKGSGTYLTEIPDQAFIFTPPTLFPAPPTTWGYYKSFYNLHQEISSGGIAPRPTTPLYRPQSGINYSNCVMSCTTDANGYISGAISGTNASDLGIATTYGIYPIWAEFKTYVNLYYYSGYTPNNSSNSGGGRYQSLRLQPGFYFENPYVYDLSSGAMKVWHCSPYVTANLELSNQIGLYQKQPTFRCNFFGDDGNGLITKIYDGLLQGYNGESQNIGDKIFPFLSKEPIQYMRPIWDCTVTTNFSKGTAKYLRLNPSGTSYLSLSDPKSLGAIDSNNPTAYGTIDIRFYQPQPTYKDTLLSHCWMESHPSSNQSDRGPWPNDTDQWAPFCLRTMDNGNNILQQICDVEMEHGSIDMTTTGGDRNTIAGNLSANYGKKIPLWLICAGLRKAPSATINYGHEYAANNSLRPFIEGNPRASMMCRTARQDDIISTSYSENSVPGNSSWAAHWLGLGDGNGNNFNRNAHIPFGDYAAFRNLFDLPHQNHRILNLGFLQHMNVGCFSYHPAYAFGNSYQNPWIPREKFFQENLPITGSVWPSHNRVEMLYDYSYCLNRALWDDYCYTSYDHDVLAFLNHHHKAFLGATEAELQSFNQAAEKMAILGAFNVNGTSIEAWTAFLASTMGAITGDTHYAEYSRIQSIDPTSNTEPSNIGLRRLTKAQIRALATAIVAQIKKCGVAGSIGAFVNRQLIKKDQDTDKLGLKGTIQAAIDSTTINDGFGGNTDLVTSARGKNWFDDEATSGPYWAGKPGYLTQADVLQSTSTTLCVRGDTFCIYAYGNALDKNGTIEAEARCEVIVQRMPELLDPAKPQLGRKYKILAIKWITSSMEIAESGDH